MSTGVVILAAGASRRMGRPKALLPLEGPAAGETFLGRIAHTARAAGLDPLVCVAGPPHGDLLRPVAAALGLRLAWNPAPERGMLSSAQAGFALLPGGLHGALLWPVDIPLIAAATLEALLAADIGRMIVPIYQDRPGHPLWVPVGLFPALLDLPPDTPGGLRQLRQAHPPLRVPVDDRQVVRDVDTPADLAGLL